MAVYSEKYVLQSNYYSGRCTFHDTIEEAKAYYDTLMSDPGYMDFDTGDTGYQIFPVITVNPDPTP